MKYKIIEWLRQRDIVEFSQFTIDWIEGELDSFEMMTEDGVCPTEDILTSSIVYHAKNVLEIMRPNLADIDLFVQIVTNFGD